jgi:hypothetical protein
MRFDQAAALFAKRSVGHDCPEPQLHSMTYFPPCYAISHWRDWGKFRKLAIGSIICAIASAPHADSKCFSPKPFMTQPFP